MTLDDVDLLESGDEREPLSLRSLGRRPLPRWGVVAVAALLAATFAAGVVTAVQVLQERAREALRVVVDVDVVDSASSTVAGVGRGRLDLFLVNRGSPPFALSDLQVHVEGMRVAPVAAGSTLGPGERQRIRISYVVPSCGALVLPGRVVLVLEVEEQPPVERELPVHRRGDPAAPDDALLLGACPPGAGSAAPGGPTDVAARAAGGRSRREGIGAEGTARVEVRNDGPPVRLLSVDARVPGVVFTPVVLAGGRTVVTDGLVVVALRFRIPDCGQLQQAGWLVLRLERFGGVQELGLRLTAEPAGGLGPQAPLPVVLDSCD